MHTYEVAHLEKRSHVRAIASSDGKASAAACCFGHVYLSDSAFHSGVMPRLRVGDGKGGE